MNWTPDDLADYERRQREHAQRLGELDQLITAKEPPKPGRPRLRLPRGPQLDQQQARRLAYLRRSGRHAEVATEEETYRRSKINVRTFHPGGTTSDTQKSAAGRRNGE
jgi:hypothetical protein